MKRRDFFQLSASASLGSYMSMKRNAGPENKARYELLDKAAAKPILKHSQFPDSIEIESLDLLRYEDNFICRVRSTRGAEGVSVSNNMQMVSLFAIFTNRLQPFFIGKDARNLEHLLEEVYVYRSNYKLQNLALWVPLATIEFAILDLLGRVVGKSMSELIGEIHQPIISVYQANNYRGHSAEESMAKIAQNVETTSAKAVKFKVGGRMSNKDQPFGRTAKLIPMVRDTFGADMTIYADSNGSYNVREAIRIGKILEEHDIDFFEEPTPFDWYEETREVSDTLNIPIAGGEQEPSMHNFRWLVGNNALDIVQPDIFYFGGMIRSMRVARMAQSVGKTCVPHISGSGLGYLYMLHFVSALPNAGPFHEFKGFNEDIPLKCDTSDLTSRDGSIVVPTGPGSGVEIDPEFIAKHTLIR